MKGWKWIVAALIISGALLFTINRPSHTFKPPQKNQDSKHKTRSNAIKSRDDLKPETLIKTSPKEKKRAIAKLSELSKQYIVRCEDPFAEYAKNNNEDAHPTLEEIYKKWSESETFELRFALALTSSNTAIPFAGDSSNSNQLQSNTLLDLVDNHPNSEIANYFLVSHCISSNDCEEAIFENAIEQDPYNGALWKLIALRNASQGKVEETLAALNKQISAANYKTYWGDATHLYEQALAEIGMADFLPRQVMAIGFSAALSLPPAGPIFKFCQQHSQSRADIAEACLKFGETQFHSGDNMLEQSLGLSLQKSIYEQLGNFEKANKIENDKKSFSDAMGHLSMAANLAMVDNDLNQYWWENIILYGETKALELTFIEATRLSSDPDYNPCPNGLVKPKSPSSKSF